MRCRPPRGTTNIPTNRRVGAGWAGGPRLSRPSFFSSCFSFYSLQFLFFIVFSSLSTASSLNKWGNVYVPEKGKISTVGPS